jgi:hypothetical protein
LQIFYLRPACPAAISSRDPPPVGVFRKGCLKPLYFDRNIMAVSASSESCRRQLPDPIAYISEGILADLILHQRHEPQNDI